MRISKSELHSLDRLPDDTQMIIILKAILIEIQELNDTVELMRT